MSFIQTRDFNAALVLLAALLICLQSALGQTPSTQPATSQPIGATSAPVSQASEAETELREGRRMMKETAAVYKNCTSYQDEGEVVTVFIKARGRNTDRKPFKTVFFRPDRFRFEFRNPDSDPGQYIVWANKTDVRTWWYVQPGVEKHKRLGNALAGPTGVSGGSAVMIPSLLLPDEIGARTLMHLKDLRFADQEKSKGVLYNILEGTDSLGGPVRVWIDADTKLVCKIFERRTFPDFRTEQTTTYKPKINANIHAADLEFNAPKE